jgi:hypothetical protein
MKLIKEGKLFDLDAAQLIATSQWYMDYGYKRRQLYKSVRGTFFVTVESTTHKEIRELQPNMFFDLKTSFHLDIEPNEVKIHEVMTLGNARNMYEYISTGNVYGGNNGIRFGYKMHVTDYKELFELEEG